MLCAVYMACGRARAQEAEEQVAQSNTLFETGVRQFTEGNVPAACESFTESYRLAPRPGTLLNLGLCHERAGEPLIARRELLEASRLAQQAGRADRQALANEHISAIEAKLAWLHFQPLAESARLLLDGAHLAVEPEQPIAVLPGLHTLRLEADGFEPRVLELAVAQGVHASVVFQPLQPMAAALPAPVATPKATEPPPRARESDASSSTLRTVAIVTGIAGVAASLAGGAWALERKGVVSDHCKHSDRTCDAQGLSAAATGRAVALASTIAFGVGATAFGVWVFLPGGPLNPEPQAGVTLRGRF